MRISTILDHIDSGHMALPEFQRGYVWNRDQVRGLLIHFTEGTPSAGCSCGQRNQRQLLIEATRLLLQAWSSYCSTVNSV